ncbi:MAG: thiamine pyrophosphate-binding protein [bacterium]|nr:thiamine pyrophosphate-binding protein [bacterium]
MKLSDYVFSFISEQGINSVFMLPGGGAMHLVDSLGKSGLQYICCLHEQAAVIAADAYAQYTGKFGVALVTTGPGGTNAITGVAGAWIDSVPVLILSGQVKRQDMLKGTGLRQKGVQEVDIISLVRPITKYAVTIVEPTSIRYEIEKAVYMATTGRPGPVWIDIPLDVQAASIDEKHLKPFDGMKAKPSGLDIENLVDKTIKMLNNSKRPVIFAGNGIRLAKVLDEFLELIEYLDIPILTTWKSIDFLPEQHRLFAGRPGSIGQRGANFVLQNSDLLISIGARLDLAQVGFNYKNFAPKAKKIIIDIDPFEIAKIDTWIELPICCDAKEFILEFLKQKHKIKKHVWSAWLAWCREMKEKYPVVLPEYWNEKNYVNTYVFIDVLSDLMEENDILVPGSSGSCSEITMQAFKVKKGQRIFNNPGLGAMGYGLPASIGACIASGRKRVVSIIGDGGLQLNIQELETVARLNLPLKIFILNNNGYASIRNMQKGHFKGHFVGCDPSSGLTLPDTCKIASAYGLKNTRIFNHENIKEKVKGVLDTDTPIVCELMINPDLPTAPRLISEVKPDGSIVSKPLEDLWPFLDREELKGNILE